MDEALEYQDLIHHEKYKKMWTKAFVKNLDQLAQGLYWHPGTNTIKYIQKQDIPGGCIVIVVDYSCLLYTSPSPRDPKTS
eukprot:2326397-Ditylum_brightwellii.AAC.1